MPRSRATFLHSCFAFALVSLAAPNLLANEVVQGHHESRLETEIRALPEQELKAFYLGCSREALRRSLGSGEVAVCSVGYEVLLQETFDGDFFALREWSRRHSGEDAGTTTRGAGSISDTASPANLDFGAATPSPSRK